MTPEERGHGTDTHVTLAIHSTQIADLSRQIDSNKNELIGRLDRQDENLKVITDIVATARGGLAMLTKMAMWGAAVSALIQSVLKLVERWNRS